MSILKAKFHLTPLKAASALKVASTSICIRVGRFRILGGGGGGVGLEYWGGQGGGFPAGTWRRTDVDATQRRHFDVMCPLGFYKSVPNNYISHLKI